MNDSAIGKAAEVQPRKATGRPFKPGASGNPRGRPPKGETWAEVIRMKMGREEKGKVITAIYNAACKGDVSAAKWLADRADGLQTQKVEIGREERIAKLMDGAGATREEAEAAVREAERIVGKG